MIRIGLVGCGKMGSAMVRGWITGGTAEHIAILDPAIDEATFEQNPSVSVYQSADEFSKRIEELAVIILAVKPQILTDVCNSFSQFVPKDALILSIAAGQTLQTLGALFHEDQPCIRAMPNTPAAIGKGITAAVPNDNISETHKTHCEQLMQSSGEFLWLDDESLMDAVTALSGSGPAYVFYLIEALSKAGADIGLSHDQALKLARQTVIGAASLAEHDSGSPASTLRENVTSPGGTTQAGLDVLMDGRLQNILIETLKAAKKRSIELS